MKRLGIVSSLSLLLSLFACRQEEERNVPQPVSPVASSQPQPVASKPSEREQEKEKPATVVVAGEPPVNVGVGSVTPPGEIQLSITIPFSRPDGAKKNRDGLKNVTVEFGPIPKFLATDFFVREAMFKYVTVYEDNERASRTTEVTELVSRAKLLPDSDDAQKKAWLIEEIERRLKEKNSPPP